MHNAARALLGRYVHDPLAYRRTAFSVGGYGALAEFQGDVDESCVDYQPASFTVVTSRGGLSVDQDADVKPVAYEAVSRLPGRWTHGIAFCLPAARAQYSRRQSIHELGFDTDALRRQDRESTLFDLGLGFPHVEFCVRTSEPALIRFLRSLSGCVFTELSEAQRWKIVSADPHRVVRSRVARIEVFQPIGRDRTLTGPHTHLLPKLITRRRTHAEDIILPEGLVPLLWIHPPAPFSRTVETAAFDALAATDFAGVFAEFGDAQQLAMERRLADAIAANDTVWPLPKLTQERRALRVALRKFARFNSRVGNLDRWQAQLDPTSAPPHMPNE